MSSSAPAVVGTTSSASHYSLSFVIAASSVGTLIEVYDFFLYGALAVFFSTLFFPPGNPTVALLASLATFATGFAVRPFGAILFGHLGDLIGRKFTFLLTLLLMGAATFLTGCLPSYASVGILAPVLLVALRLLQGIAFGGEWGGALTYVAEHAPDGRRGFYVSIVQSMATLGLIMSLGVILAFRLSMSEDAFKAFGWRYPFMLSAILVLLAAYMRLRLRETPLFARLQEQGKATDRPLAVAFGSGRNWRLMIVGLFGAAAPSGVIWYTAHYYSIYFMQTVLKIDYVTVSWIMLAALVAATPFYAVMGALSDRFGRRTMMMAGFFLSAVIYLPAFLAMHENAANPVVLGLLVFIMVVAVTMAYGSLPPFLVELFPAQIRYTSLSLPYHIGNGVFGGFVPLISTSLVAATGNIYMGLAYPILTAVMGVIVCLVYVAKRTHEIRIWDEVGGGPAGDQTARAAAA
jgi:MFS family permease